MNVTGEGKATNDSTSYKRLGTKSALPTDESYGQNYTGAKFVEDAAGNIYLGTLADSDNTSSDADFAITVKDGNSTKTQWITPQTAELNENQIAAIKAYVGDLTPVVDATVNAKNNNTAVTSLEVTGLTYGYYYVTTTTGSVVSITSTSPNAETKDKNTVPTVDKTIETVIEAGSSSKTTDGGSVNTDKNNAVAEYGSTVNFESVITIGKGATNYVFKDKMDTGLTLVTGENYGDIKVYKRTKDGSGTVTDTEVTASNNYTVYTQSDYTQSNPNESQTAINNMLGTGANAQTFVISFDNTYIGTLSEGDTLVVKYAAVVTADNFTTDPKTNTAKVTYNNNDTTESKVNVYSAKITVTKNFEGVTGTEYPEAGFVLRRGEGTTASPYEYYLYTAAGEDSQGSVKWVSLTKSAGQSEDDALKAEIAKEAANRSITELKTKTGTNGNVLEFKGLADGTYTLIETTTPAGYNTAVTKEITINGANTENFSATTAVTRTDTTVTGANLTPATTIENKKGSVLPSTGGIGTTIFYIVGGVLIAGAAVLLIFRRRRRA